MKRLRHILTNIPNILNGWWNYFFQTDAIEVLARKRANVCKNCPHMIPEKLFPMNDDRNPWLTGMQCELCGCMLPTKVRSIDERCGAGKWEE